MILIKTLWIYLKSIKEINREENRKYRSRSFGDDQNKIQKLILSASRPAKQPALKVKMLFPIKYEENKEIFIDKEIYKQVFRKCN